MVGLEVAILNEFTLESVDRPRTVWVQSTSVARNRRIQPLLGFCRPLALLALNKDKPVPRMSKQGGILGF